MICGSTAIGYQFVGQTDTGLHILAQLSLNPDQNVPMGSNVDFAIDHFDQNGVAIGQGKRASDLDRKLQPLDQGKIEAAIKLDIRKNPRI